MEYIELNVSGMSCQHCVRAVQEALLAVEGVTSAAVDLDTGLATISGENLEPQRLLAAVEAADYGAQVSTTR